MWLYGGKGLEKYCKYFVIFNFFFNSLELLTCSSQMHFSCFLVVLKKFEQKCQSIQIKSNPIIVYIIFYLSFRITCVMLLKYKMPTLTKLLIKNLYSRLN